MGSVPANVQAAIWAISKDTGDAVSVKAAATPLRVMGQREDITTVLATIGEFGGENDETLLSTNGITHVISSNVGDTEPLVLDGFTISSGAFTAAEQTVTLNGQTPVALATPLARLITMRNSGATLLVGDVFSYEGGTTTLGVPDDATEIHNQIVAGRQRADKAACVAADGQYIIITEVVASILKKATGIVDISFEVRLSGGVFQRVASLSVSTDGTNTIAIQPDPPGAVPPNADIRVRAVAVAGSGIAVSASLGGYIAGPY